MTISVSTTDGIGLDRSIHRMTNRAARGLGLAASPVFALMAWITVGDAAQPVICSVGVSPLHGMPWMYALMAVFHLRSWLRLVSGRRRTPLQTTGQPTSRTEGN